MIKNFSHIVIGAAEEPNRRVARKTSVDEDEGFCDSDSTDKAPILPPRQDDIRREERKRKNPLRKRVSFRNDVDEIPSMDIKINQSIVSLEMKPLAMDFISKPSNVREDISKAKLETGDIDDKIGNESKTRTKSKGEKSKNNVKQSKSKEKHSRHKRKWKT